MAQGKLKTNVKVPVHGKPKHKDRNKNKGPKRGGRIIAPKKAKLVQVAKLKKGLENTIRASIEQDASARASAMEPRSLHLVQSEGAAASNRFGNQSGKSKSKGKKHGKKP
ncbi:leydig cell tumor 10 kDa protein homolog [Liolophura sinensis]|uniref:leydig cell tumor 10 kDa protein homolog n=1 Tax=Liolophura sinensis TaxID=3198878 RepID=UPI0031593E59